MRAGVVITGIGMVTPLGQRPADDWRGIETGKSAAAPPRHFDATPFSCPVCAEVKDFQPRAFLSEAKMIRLMNRDAQLAVAAARLALADARVTPGETYPAEQVGLFGATGMAGLPLGEVIPLVKASTGSDGGLDLGRFGKDGLRAVNPILSFKILSNMPLCFVSICENIQGANGIYTPWEGQGAQAVDAAIRALECGEARCVLVGGCDVKTHELAFLTLEQYGWFACWRENGAGLVPGEGAVFLVLETAAVAAARGARIYARFSRYRLGTHPPGAQRTNTCARILGELELASEPLGAVVAADNGDIAAGQDERLAMSALDLSAPTVIRPKRQAGDLFAAAAALQIGLGAWLVNGGPGRVLANCFGPGSELAAFVLEKP